MVSAVGAKLGLAAIPLAVRLDGIALGSNPFLATVGSVDLRATFGDKEIAIEQTAANNIRAVDDLVLIPNVPRSSCRLSRLAARHPGSSGAPMEAGSCPMLPPCKPWDPVFRRLTPMCWPTTQRSYLAFVGLRFGS